MDPTGVPPPGNGVSDEALGARGTTPAGASRPAPPKPSFRRAFASRPFLLLWASQLVSQSGDYVFDVALLWLVFSTTGSALAVSVVVTAAIVPTVVLGPVLGVYVDRWPRRAILLGTNVLEGVLVAGLSALVLTHGADLALIVGVVFALGVGGQLVRVTSTALVPQTVGREDLTTANSLVSFSASTNQVAGLAIGGVVVALVGPTIPIAYDALSFFAAAAIVARVSAEVGRPEADATIGRFADQFREGLRYVRSQRLLLELIAIGLVTNFAGNAAFALWAPYAGSVLHGGAATYGFLGAMIALGAIVGAVLVGKVEIRGSAGRVVFAGLLGFGAGVLALGLTRSIPLALAESFAVGFVSSVINIPLFSAVQAKVPARLMGRVLSVLLGLLLAAAPFGAFFAGELALAVSIPFVYLVAGVLVLATGALGLVVLGEVRRLTYCAGGRSPSPDRAAAGPS